MDSLARMNTHTNRTCFFHIPFMARVYSHMKRISIRHTNWQVKIQWNSFEKQKQIVVPNNLCKRLYDEMVNAIGSSRTIIFTLLLVLFSSSLRCFATITCTRIRHCKQCLRISTEFIGTQYFYPIQSVCMIAIT